MAVFLGRSAASNATLYARRWSSVPDDAILADALVIYLKLPKRTLHKLAQESSALGHKVRGHWRFQHIPIDAWLCGGGAVQ